MTRRQSTRARRAPFTASLLLVAATAATVALFAAGPAGAVVANTDCTTNHHALPSTISSGTYTIAGVCYGPFHMNPGDTVTLQGVAPGATLDGQNDGTYATLDIDGANVTVKNLLVTNGDGGGNGGGIGAYDSATVSLQNTTVWNNMSAGWGGGIALDHATLTIVGGAVKGNTAAYGGGGIEATANSTVHVTNAAISGNTAQSRPGGGLSVDLFNGSGTATLTGAVVSGNTAPSGGGIYLQDSTLTSTGSTITQNKATASPASDTGGGGIYVDGAEATLTSTAVSWNASASHGGGIFVLGDALDDMTCGLDLYSSTVDHNTAADDGGGIYQVALYADAETALDRTAVSFNRAGEGAGIANYGSDGNTADLVITGSSLGGNVAKFEGGAIYNSNGFFFSGGGVANVSIASTRIGQSGNSLNPNQASYGGGIFNTDGDGLSSMSLLTTAVVHNKATTSGGGIFDCASSGITMNAGVTVFLNSPSNIVTALACPA